MIADDQIEKTDDNPVRVAYLILAHGNPEQLARLTGRLPATSPIFVHFDQRADPALFDRTRQLLGPDRRVTFVGRHFCQWGNIGIVKGTMSMIDALTASGKRFDHAILLSGADYPIKSNREISEFLSGNPGKEFIESFSLMEPNRWSSYGGYYKTPEKVLALHLRFRSRVLRLPIVRKFPLGLTPYGGSQWWCLSAEAIRQISSHVASHPGLIRYFARSFIPDESFIQTVLSNSSLANRVVSDDLRLTIWDRPNPPYPATLKVSDFELLNRSEKLFARKFNPGQDSKILDMLDERNDAKEKVEN